VESLTKERTRAARQVNDSSVISTEQKPAVTVQEPEVREDDLPSHIENEDYDFPNLVPIDSISQPIDVPLIQTNSIFSNFAPDELLQNTGAGLSRQASTMERPLALHAEESSSKTDKEDS
jgi:hypothetical protein